MQVSIRKAIDKDIADIFNLVKELARYERSEDQVIATLDDYVNAFSNGTFDALVAHAGDQVIGCALYYLTWSTWRGKMYYLEDFIVAESFRGKGIGGQLFKAFLEEAKAQECRIVKWQVLDWNEPALRFYEKHKAIIEKEWWNGKILFNQD